MDVDVVDDEEVNRARRAGEKQIYVLSRVIDTDPTDFSARLRARQLRTPCEDCREICWYDPKGYQVVAILAPEMICSRCIIGRIRRELREKN